MDIIKADSEYIANTYSRFPIVLASGKGSIVKDCDGKEYIDMATGIAVNVFGVGDEEWKKAVVDQLDKIPHTSNLYYSEPCVNLAKLMVEKTNMNKVFFANSGAEANECAIKVARKYAQDKKGAEYFNVITLKNSFHGRTITTLSATGQDVFHKDFLPLTEGFLYAEPNNLQSVEELVKTNKVAGILLEVVQGEGGVIALDEEFLKGVEAICKQNDILFMCDEVQCGNGRSGELFAYMNFDLRPDVFTTAKGIGGGLPLGVCVLGEKVKDVLTPSSHGSTFGGNPVATAGAFSIFSRIDQKLLDEVKKKSAYIFNELKGASGIKSVTGLGLMIGVETVKPSTDVINECIKNGVLFIKAKSKVRLLPALNIDDELLKKAIKVLKEACKV